MERKGHIIWIDDEIHHLKPHILFLEAKGYKITTATNGSDANILNQEIPERWVGKPQQGPPQVPAS